MSSSSSPSTLVFSTILSSSFLVSLLFLFLSSPFLLSASRETPHQKCVHEHLTALLNLKRGFDLHLSSTKLSSWNVDYEDCCSWEGVTCDTSTGHVIGLNLSCLQIQGLVDFQSLFRLRSLQKLDLSYNAFNVLPIPSGFHQLASLTHLHLSHCSFYGQIPLDFSRLTSLVALDLSYNNAYCVLHSDDCAVSLRLKNLGMRGLLQNLSSLRELHLDLVDLSTEAGQALSYAPSDLQRLSMSHCRLSGPIHPPPSPLRLITHIDLSENNLCSPVPDVIANFTSLTSLNLQGCCLHSEFPKSIFNLPRIQTIDISGNPLLTGYLPEFSPNSSIQILKIHETGFYGKLPHSLGNLKSLTELFFDDCNLSGPIPQSHVNLSQLCLLKLSNNRLSGPIPSTLFSLPSLMALDLSNNHFNGELGMFENASSSRLHFMALNENNLQGCVPSSLFEFTELGIMDLSSNNFSSIELYIFSSLGSLNYLNLSRNAFERIEGPLSLLTFTSLEYIDLSFNKLKGLIPMPPPTSSFFSISNNKFSGDVPSQICNAAILEVMDLSNNNFSGRIPECLGGMSDLYVLKLRGNNFNGTLPQAFKDSCSLRTIDLEGNRLEGHLPKSMANCKTLEVLDLGNNRIYGTFPVWLKDMPQLRVLVLRSNQFHGTLEYHPTANDFPQLQIFDISFNNFTGRLPSDIFKDWKAMMVNNKSETSYLGDRTEKGIYYEDTVTVVGKGIEMRLERILTAFTLLDLSNNKFEGGIPMSVGDLRSLHIINMSHNGFTGQIPASMGDIRELESLDLSQNQLSGEIPWQLAKLPWLEVLNLSRNLLVGNIPQGPQFNTFTNESFQGNLGLCGPPLSKKCEDDVVPPPTAAELESGYDWEFMWIGFGIGHGVGLGILIWTLALWRKGRIAFFIFADKKLSLLFPPAAFSCLQQRRGNRRRNRRPRLRN